MIDSIVMGINVKVGAWHFQFGLLEFYSGQSACCYGMASIITFFVSQAHRGIELCLRARFLNDHHCASSISF